MMNSLARWPYVMLVGYAISFASHAQDYRYREYRVKDGLPSDIVKAVTQDTLGFFWIATDEGIAKFDGVRLIPYKSALTSQFAKGFLQTGSGRLLAFGDLDLIEIQNQVDTVVFRTIFTGRRNPTDTTLWYPKSLYEDKSGHLWMGEPQAVSRIVDGRLSRYYFDQSNRSPVFTRSFSFFESREGEFFTVSYQGNVFRYDKASDDFKIETGIVFPAGVNHVEYYRDAVWIGSRSGLYRCEIVDGNPGFPEMVAPIRSINYIRSDSDSVLWLCTDEKEIHRFEFTNNGYRWRRLKRDFYSVNSCYLSYEGDLWAATNRGVVLIQRNLFRVADLRSLDRFTEAIAYDSGRDVLYYCNKDELKGIDLKTNSANGFKSYIVDRLEDGYFLALQQGKRGLWASNAYSVRLYKDDELIQTWNFADEGRFIHDTFLDSRNNLWLCQSGNGNAVVITDSLSVLRYPVPISSQTNLNAIREGPRGMYGVAGNGPDSYLFLKEKNASSFKNISLPIPFRTEGDFFIHDFVVTGDTIWLASTEGLLKYDHSSVQRINLGDRYSGHQVRSIEVLGKNQILFSNSFGLFRYDTKTGNYWLYDENSGIPSNTITDRGIFVDVNGRTWIGTSSGIAVAESTIVLDKKTERPYCVEALKDGSPIRYMNNFVVPYGSVLTFKFSSITFPEDRVYMQWRHSGVERDWRIMNGNEITLSELSSGNHTLEVRAKKYGGADWSDAAVIHFGVDKAMWELGWVRALFVVFLALIAWASYLFTMKISNRRKQYLERLVEARTSELRQRNNELDRFVYSISHDLSAPLKSLLGLIFLAKRENKDQMQKQYLDMMEKSVLKEEQFIGEVTDFSRNTRQPVHIEVFDCDKLISEIVDDLQYSPDFSRVRLQIEIKVPGLIRADKMRFKIILNSLMSNAIKFQRRSTEISPVVRVRIDDNGSDYLLTIKDNGIGIPTEHIGRIFEMFYRASEQSQGSGLGLYIVKETVTKLGGVISVKSRVGWGTKFTVYLPKVHVSEVAPTVAA
jgi:signal transduction histidine kinase/ligand-binding sensor domain-containing protein